MVLMDCLALACTRGLAWKAIPSPASEIIGRSSLLCHFGRRGDEVLRKSSQVVLVVDDELEGICLGEHVLSEGELQHRDFLVELAELLLLVGREVGTAAHKTLVGLFEEFLLLLVELLLRLVVIHILNSLEEGGIHRDVVAVL